MIASRNYLHIRLDGLPRMLNSFGRSTNRWVVRKEKLAWQRKIADACKEHGSPRYERAEVKLVRHSSVRPDYDNLVGGFKGCIDALVLCGVLANDHYRNIGWPKYDWEKAPPGKSFFTIEVWGEK